MSWTRPSLDLNGGFRGSELSLMRPSAYRNPMTSFLRLKNAEKENKTLENLATRLHRGVLRTARAPEGHEAARFSYLDCSCDKF